MSTLISEEGMNTFVARARIAHVDNGLSSSFVLRQHDDARFIWHGESLPDLSSTDSETAARRVLEEWASKDPEWKLEWL